MHQATTLRIVRIEADIITTTGGRFTFGPMPAAHVDERHADPKVNDILITARHTPKDAPHVVVYVYNGCGCQFLIYPLAEAA
jgi:hypothetical protein